MENAQDFCKREHVSYFDQLTAQRKNHGVLSLVLSVIHSLIGVVVIIDVHTLIWMF